MLNENSRKVMLRRMGLAGLTTALLALAGCGGGGGGNDSNNNAGTGSGITSAQNDSFIAKVTAIVAASSEIGDPEPTDGITASAPEQTEPTPLS